MTPEELFNHAGTIAIAGWFILLFAPRRWPALNAVPAYVIPALLSALYASFILRFFADAGGGYDSFAEVKTLLSDDWMLLAGWTHFLAFDLFVGAWVAREMDRDAINRIVQLPVLLSILYFGPLGLLLGFVLLSGVRSRIFQRKDQINATG